MEINRLIQLFQSPEAKLFVEENINNNPTNLYLKYSDNSDKKALIDQIFIRQKVVKKLPEWYANSELIYAKKLSHEQSSSEATAKLKSTLIEGAQLMDITGGMGVDLYYMSNSFSNSIYVEKQSELFNITQHNFHLLNKKNILFENGDGIEALSKFQPDVIYIDPARRGDNNEKFVSFSDCEPDVTLHLDELVKDGRTTLVKSSPMLDIKKAILELKFVVELWVISSRNECKEVVYVLSKKQVPNIVVKTFNILADGSVQCFDFELQGKGKVEIAEMLGAYLFEPNASLQKSKGVDQLGESMGLKKLHPDTNLYTSDSIPSEFPGKCFKVINEIRPYHRALKKGRFNVIARNYPDKANVIQQKLRLKSSSDQYLIACRTSFNNYTFILAQQIN